MSAATRLSGEPAGKGTFAVPSATFPGEHHVVIWVSEGAHWCGCQGFTRQQRCRHAAAVALAVETEAREMVTGTPASRAEAAARLHEIEEMFAL